MAKQIVAGELYEILTGQLFEIWRQLRQPNGYPFDPKQLKPHLQSAIEGRFLEPTGTFKRDMRKEGWKLLENTSRSLVSTSGLELVSFLKDGDGGSINGEELVLRARAELNANYSQEDAEYLLEHQDEIPKEFQRYYLVFTGTVWEDSVGDRRVAYLHFGDGRWYLRFRWLGSDFYSRARLLRPRK